MTLHLLAVTQAFHLPPFEPIEEPRRPPPPPHPEDEPPPLPEGDPPAHVPPQRFRRACHACP
jgi:hypothetical protein